MIWGVRGVSETRVGHWEHDDCDVYIGRGRGGTVDVLDAVQGEIDVGDRGWLGNPYPVADYGREGAIAAYQAALDNVLDKRPRWRRLLVERCRGQVLGCWCRRLDEDDGAGCHGDVIARYVDRVITGPDAGDEPRAVPDGGGPEGDPCPACGDQMDVGAVGNPGETITWQSCDECEIGWWPFTGWVDQRLDDELAAETATLDQILAARECEPVTDGGTDVGRWIRRVVDATLTHAGVADQDDSCENGTDGCPEPGTGRLPCFDCLLQGGEE